ncbi:hypothetical protein J437_LFUL004149 [Ladona fulva]|uniref:AB hydrolase-1 domain-containing protein n=1 Tax=Ladona fulva TaxID=123851 RepID=A0A8K0K108_LADFU|nr:hypothetical protein J437_LFUL004149 [Ladona fulva]
MKVILIRLCIFSISLFCASLALIRLFVRWIINPTKNIFKAKERKDPPACLLDSNIGDHRYIKLKDVKLHYVEKGDKSKPLMLFLHGFPEFWYSWRHQMKEFSKDYWTVAVDLRGYGDSDKPEGLDKYRKSILVDDVKQLIEGLGRNKCILVAHDWGGVIGWRFAALYPEMLEKFIVMNAPPEKAYYEVAVKHKKQIFMSWYIFFFQLPYLPELVLRSEDMIGFNVLRYRNKKNIVTDEDIEAYKYTFGKEGAWTAPINYYRANIFNVLHKKPNPKQSPNITVPTLLIWGDKDLYLDERIVGYSKKYVNDLTIEIIKDANHFVQQDDPKGTNEAMRRYLEY